MTDQRNLILAIVLSIAILLGFQFLYEVPRMQEAQQASSSAPQEATAPAAETQQSASEPATEELQDRTELLGQELAAGQRIAISTPSLHGSISRTGGRIDDLTLANYRVTPDKESPEIILLSPTGAKLPVYESHETYKNGKAIPVETTDPYYAEFGWTSPDAALELPGNRTEWQGGGKLTPSSPVTLTWDNGKGLVFERTVSVDENYMFTVTQTVRNTSDKQVSLAPYGQIVRYGTPKTAGFFILHEGPVGVLDNTLREFKYNDLADDNGAIQQRTTGGWLGITDKYWLVSLIPEQNTPVTARVSHAGNDDNGRYLVNTVADTQTLAPGQSTSHTMHLFAGAKKVNLLDAYGEELGIPKFDLAVDFGWFYFLTKPFFHALDFLGRTLGNFGLAILAFTVLVRLALFPLANKSYTSMSKMKKLQPELLAIREKCGKDQARMSQEIMALYKREKVNPLNGCLPMILQIPVFFALYKVLFVSLEMRHAPFYGWINDLSAPDPTSLFNLFGLIPWDPPTVLMIGVWPILMGITMFLQQKMNPAPADPVQAKVFMFMPPFMTYMLAAFPVGLVIYWTWNNLLSIAQQWFIMRRMGVKVT